MKTAFWLPSLLCLATILPDAGADPLDDRIAEMKSGGAAGDPAKLQNDVQAGLSKAGAVYRTAMVNDYLFQVKASIVDEENHGGWPCRSTLVYTASTRRALTSGLKSRFEQKPDAMVAYALICPAIYAKDDVLLNRALDYLRKNDPFLHQRAQLHMNVFWVPFINELLSRQRPSAATGKKDLKELDDPFSVLPR